MLGLGLSLFQAKGALPLNWRGTWLWADLSLPKKVWIRSILHGPTEISSAFRAPSWDGRGPQTWAYQPPGLGSTFAPEPLGHLQVPILPSLRLVPLDACPKDSAYLDGKVSVEPTILTTGDPWLPHLRLRPCLRCYRKSRFCQGIPGMQRLLTRARFAHSPAQRLLVFYRAATSQVQRTC